MSRYDVAVIGAGPNGLTAAATLAGRGRKVVVLERRDVVGGLAVGDEFHEGRRAGGLLHDTALVSARVVASLSLERHGLQRSAAPTPLFAPQRPGSGPGLLLHHDGDAAASEIAVHSERDAGRYRELRQLMRRLAPLLNELYDQPPPEFLNGSVGNLLGLARRGLAFRRLGRDPMLELLRTLPMCLADLMHDWFDTELLQAMLAGRVLEGTFAGPRSPGTGANFVRRETMVEGSVAVAGGAVALVDALLAAAIAEGVTVRTSAGVRAIDVTHGAVTGVTLDDGETVEARLVASSCDPKRTFTELLGSRDVTRRLEQRVGGWRARGTTAKVDLVLREPLRFACRPDLEFEHARTGETLDELERAFDAVKYGRFSETPTLDVRAADSEAMVSIVAHFAPCDLDGGWTDERREELLQNVLATLDGYAPGIRDRVTASRVLAPPDLEAIFGVTQGHIHHGEHAIDQLVVRPTPECARYATPIEGLFLCGSGSHPGGGLTCRPGALAADTLCG